MTQLLPRICSISMLALCALAASCSQGAAEDAVPGGDPAPSPQAYLDRFIKDDPATCIGEADLMTAQMEQKNETTGSQPLRRAVILIDGSRSMNGRLDGHRKLDLARQAAKAFIDTLPPDVEASLVAFGQQGNNTKAGKTRSCAAIDTLMPMTADHGALAAALYRTKAVGWTPLAQAMTEAEASLAQSSISGEQIIYVVSDGEETCGGDPVATARQINQGQARAIVDIIGFGLPENEAASLRAVASAGGGTFVDIKTKQTFDQTMAKVHESIRQAGNAVRASDAISSNAVNTSKAIAYASVCISKIISSESVRVSDDLSTRANRGEREPSMRSVLDLLKVRHQDMKSRLKVFMDRLEASQRDVRSNVDKATQEAK
ncbi:VWA domain-containing protein [Xanthobacter sp. DSM 24535]|uniref:vWA domain-containing protein n=1 Tax=Roseixanthobacter psychrophilus TaxID=3119917 RepID=UPI003729453E